MSRESLGLPCGASGALLQRQQPLCAKNSLAIIWRRNLTKRLDLARTFGRVGAKSGAWAEKKESPADQRGFSRVDREAFEVATA